LKYYLEAVLVKDEEWQALSHFENFLDVLLSDASQKVILFLTFVSQVEVGQVSLRAAYPLMAWQRAPSSARCQWIALCSADFSVL
jgi:hypothetical protein